MELQRLAKVVRRELCLDRSTAESMREDTPHTFTLKRLSFTTLVSCGLESRAVCSARDKRCFLQNVLFNGLVFTY